MILLCQYNIILNIYYSIIVYSSKTDIIWDIILLVISIDPQWLLDIYLNHI